MPTTANDVFMSILAMDSYNRGYAVGIAGLGGIGSTIGSATLSFQSGVEANDPERTASFYAAAYDWNGTTVISYRVTDSALDAWTGWAVAAGVAADGPAYVPGSQAALAADFYTAVTNQGLYDGAASNVILTGHSQGGGLAGYISALTGTSATIFDNMPYSAAAFVTWLAHAAYETGIAIVDMLDGDGNLLPDYTPPSSLGITSVHVDGEILQAARALEPEAAAWGSLQ